MADEEGIPCRACGKRIVFLVTVKGREIPVDAETVEPGDRQFTSSRHVAHFATCTHPERFRKRMAKARGLRGLIDEPGPT